MSQPSSSSSGGSQATETGTELFKRALSVGSENVFIGNRGSQNAKSGLIVRGEGNALRANTFNNNGQNGICAVEGNRNAGLNRGRNNIGANVAFNVPSCPVGIVPNGRVASAALTTIGLAEPADDDGDDDDDDDEAEN